MNAFSTFNILGVKKKFFLQEFVLDGLLDRPPASLANDYLGYLLAEGQLPQYEQSVCRLPVESLDLHQASKKKFFFEIYN